MLQVRVIAALLRITVQRYGDLRGPCREVPWPFDLGYPSPFYFPRGSMDKSPYSPYRESGKFIAQWFQVLTGATPHMATGRSIRRIGIGWPIGVLRWETIGFWAHFNRRPPGGRSEEPSPGSTTPTLSSRRGSADRERRIYGKVSLQAPGCGAWKLGGRAGPQGSRRDGGAAGGELGGWSGTGGEAGEDARRVARGAATRGPGRAGGRPAGIRRGRERKSLTV